METTRPPTMRWRPLSFGEILDRGMHVMVRTLPVAWPLLVVLGTAHVVGWEIARADGAPMSRLIASHVVETMLGAFVLPLWGAVALLFASELTARRISLRDALLATRASLRTLYSIAFLVAAIDFPAGILVRSVSASLRARSYMGSLWVVDISDLVFGGLVSVFTALAVVTSVNERRTFLSSIDLTWRRFIVSGAAAPAVGLILVDVALAMAIQLADVLMRQTSWIFGLRLDSELHFMYHVAFFALKVLIYAWSVQLWLDARVRYEGYDLELEAAT